MLLQDFIYIPPLPDHAHVSERAKRAKATLGVAEASEATCICIYYICDHLQEKDASSIYQRVVASALYNVVQAV